MPGREVGFAENEIGHIAAADDVPALAEIVDNAPIKAASNLDHMRRLRGVG